MPPGELRNRPPFGSLTPMTTNAHTTTLLALLDDTTVVYVTGDPGAYTVTVYDPATLETLHVGANRLRYGADIRPQVKLTRPQRDVVCFRFEDVATDTDDFGGYLIDAPGSPVFQVTDALQALLTLDNAAELCADAAADGMADRVREGRVTRNLRAKVLAAILAG